MVEDLSLAKEGDILFQKTYKTNVNGGTNWIAQASMCAETLKYNLQEVCRQFVIDINEYFLEHPLIKDEFLAENLENDALADQVKIQDAL